MSRKTLFEFVRERIVPINAVFVFTGGLVVALDFVAPKGAYLAVVGMGLALLFVLLMIVDLVFHDTVHRWLDRPAIGLIRLVKGLWMGQSQIWKSAAWQFAITISLLIVGLGMYSKAKAETGGILASQFESVATLQKSLLGIQMDLQDIKQTLKNVKQETSTDPRKELVNLGIQFSEDGLNRAVAEGDIRALELFVQAKFTLSEGKEDTIHRLATTTRIVISRALETDNEKITQLVQEMVGPHSLEGCKTILMAGYIKEDTKINPSKAHLLKKICDRQDFKDYIFTLLKDEENNKQAAQLALNKWEARSQAEKQRAEELERDCWAKARRNASSLFSAPDCGRYNTPPQNYGSRDLAAYKIILSLIN